MTYRELFNLSSDATIDDAAIEIRGYCRALPTGDVEAAYWCRMLGNAETDGLDAVLPE